MKYKHKSLFLAITFALSTVHAADDSPVIGGAFKYNSEGDAIRSVTAHADGSVRDSNTTGKIYNGIPKNFDYGTSSSSSEKGETSSSSSEKGEASSSSSQKGETSSSSSEKGKTSSSSSEKGETSSSSSEKGETSSSSSEKGETSSSSSEKGETSSSSSEKGETSSSSSEKGETSSSSVDEASKVFKEKATDFMRDTVKNIPGAVNSSPANKAKIGYDTLRGWTDVMEAYNNAGKELINDSKQIFKNDSKQIFKKNDNKD